MIGCRLRGSYLILLSYSDVDGFSGYSGANSQSGFDRYSDLVCAGHTVPQRATAAGGQSSSVYMSIISEQTFTGCWELNTELSNLLHVSLDELQKSAPVKVHYLLLSLFLFSFFLAFSVDLAIIDII